MLETKVPSTEVAKYLGGRRPQLGLIFFNP